MDVFGTRLEKLKRLRLEQNIGVTGLELECCKNDIRFDLLVCGGSLDFILSVFYWLMASNTIPPLTVIFSGLLFFTVYDFNSTGNQPLMHLQNDSSPLFVRVTIFLVENIAVLTVLPFANRIRETLQAYMQLLVWPKIVVNWYLSIREEHSALFYFISSGFLLWLYQIGNSITGIMALYLLLLAYVTFPMIGITICFDWMLAIGGKSEDPSVPPEESLIPEPTEENARLWELSAAEEIEEQHILEEFQPSLTGLQLDRADEEESLGLDLRLDQAHIPDVNDSDSNSSSSETQKMNFSIHHFSSSCDDTLDNITSKLEDASKEAVNIPPARKTRSSKVTSVQPEASSSNRDSDEECLDEGSFEVISREEFNL